MILLCGFATCQCCCHDTENEISATAWAGRLQAICGVLGFALASAAGSGRLSGNTGISDLIVLCVIVDIPLLAMVFAACSARRCIATKLLMKETETAISAPETSIFLFLTRMPSEVRHVLMIQWYSWMAWFPFTAYNAS